MTDTELTPHAARELIDVASTAGDRGDALAGRAWLAPAMSVFLGALMAAFLLAAIYLFPTATGLQAAAISGGYAVGILIVVTAYNLGRKVVTRGWLARYRRGVAYSSGVFFVALALSFLVEERSLLLWLPLAVITALPVAVLGTRRDAR
ncbi:hypothetical protein ACEXQB_002890 [Herbiconiux sp. P18]|uniref:hypothetical protein n=1 Tax=Herbiconiux liangxiaofengii TaxID=3342795 RepID=UPI0035BB8C01